jgi:hypothetical protein
MNKTVWLIWIALAAAVLAQIVPVLIAAVRHR